MRKLVNGETVQCADCEGLVPAWTYRDRHTGEMHDTCWRCRSAFRVCNGCGQFAPKDALYAGNCERCATEAQIEEFEAQ